MDLVNYEDQLPADWREQVKPAMKTTTTARHGSPACPNFPNACYCTGACNDITPRLQMGMDAKFSAARKPAFVEEHNAEKDITGRCEARDYQRSSSLAPVGEDESTRAAANLIGEAARAMSAAESARLVKRIDSGEIAPGINAGVLIMPQEAQHLRMDTPVEYIDAAYKPVANEAKEQFAPMKEVLDGLESILRYKNQKYGNSGLSEVGVLSKASALDKLLARADDKIARIKNSDVLRKNDVCDLIGYLVLICAKQGWNDFTDQQD
jgi:hypothetical protein